MNLAIQGHSTRGREVIALLEMLGGRNYHNLCGDNSYTYYIIDSDKKIIKGCICVFSDEELLSFTLEQFEEKFPYKVGDKVWLHFENLTAKVTETITCMHWCNKCNCVLYDVSTCCNLREYAFTPYKEETMKEVRDNWAKWDLPDGYEFQDKDGNIINTSVIKLVKKQPKYPTTYVECAKILNCFSAVHIDGYKNELLEKLQELLICRDAYWKIAGEQMGLGKPWEPNWNTKELKYIIYYENDELWFNDEISRNTILAFPTEEMRDAFFENFKELIELCKELL